MRFASIVAGVALAVTSVAALETPLDIQNTVANNCADSERAKKGDQIWVHYRGRLESTGKEFDASYKRNAPFSLKLGTGQVIRGWDEGLIGMCKGDERVLTIQPEYGYGSRGMGPIPANSVLVFDTKMVSINQKPGKDEL